MALFFESNCLFGKEMLREDNVKVDAKAYRVWVSEVD
jgi:hypothetical protein